jgi:hypothetical protein
VIPTFPDVLWVSGSHIEPYDAEPMEDILADPRGLLLMWSPPKPKARYVMGCDPTVGRTGWTRATRFDGDRKIDNGAIGVFEVDAIKEPMWTKEGGKRIPDIDPITKEQRWFYRDLQVAEFAAPCDAVEIARVCNVLGRIYAGTEGDQCELIYESFPGPGMMTTQELLRLGYGNIWMWETFADGMAEPTRSMGWHSTPRSQQILWYRAQRHLLQRKAIIRSKWLLEELSNAEIDPDRMRAKAASGFHDDRIQMAMMAFWAAHRWTQDSERSDEPVTSAPVIDHQRYAPVLGETGQSYKDARESFDWEE